MRIFLLLHQYQSWNPLNKVFVNEKNQIIKLYQGRTFCLILLFWLFLSYSYAQNKFVIGIKIMPELSAISNSHYLNVKAMHSISGGIQGLISFKKNVIETGVYYQNRGFQSKNVNRTPNGKRYVSKSNYYYLSFPLLLRREHKSFYASVGLSYDVFVLHYRVLLGKRIIEMDPNISKYTISGLASIGYERKLTPNFTAYIEVRFNSTLLKYYIYQGDNLRMYNYGIGIGGRYNIK